MNEININTQFKILVYYYNQSWAEKIYDYLCLHLEDYILGKKCEEHDIFIDAGQVVYDFIYIKDVVPNLKCDGAIIESCISPIFIQQVIAVGINNNHVYIIE